MNRVKKGLDNQAIGLLPLLLFMFLDNYFSYLLSFIIGVTFCFVCIFLFQVLSKDKVYQFMLLPSAGTLVLYSVFLCLKLEPVLFIYSPLITEVLLVVALAIVGFTRRTVIQRIRDSKRPSFKRTLLRTTLNEFYFLAQLVQNLYTLHLFIILLYSILPETMQNMRTERFLYRELGLVIGVLVIVYEQIRLSLMQGSLKKEMWVPVLNDNGKVIGCIARSVSRSLPKKYYHPIVRIAVVYNGMLYLVTQQIKVPVTAMKEENKDRYIPGLDGELLGTQNIILPPDSDGNAYTMVSSWKLSGDVQRQDVKAVIGRYLDVYMTESNLYLSTTLYADTDKKEKYDQTRIVKLQLYQGRLIGDKTETMQGTITSSFGIQEREDKLYVITQILHYQYEDDPDMIGTVIGSTEVCAYAFDQNFRLLSKQKNIAKDEDIKAVRFLDDMGYVVTYQQRDPLFSIDFSDPEKLKVVDKIEMPGFSGYLHPVKDDLLLGIGEAEDGNAKISLYDITDNHKLSIYDEKEIDHIKYNNVLEDYRKIFIDEENNIAGFGGTDYGDSDDEKEENREQNYYVLYHYDRDGKLQQIGEYPVKKEYRGFINQKFIGMRIGTWFYVIPEATSRQDDMEIVPYS